MKFIINADGFGRTKGITDSILECVDKGVLSGVSILPNGDAFDYAVAQLKKRGDLRIAVHLNLFDGRPVADCAKIPDLVNSRGFFRQSFLSLWMKYVLSNASDRRILKQQVKLEIFAQITKVLQVFGRGFPIKVDSVRHFHMIPFVFEGLFELREEFKYDYIRIPKEPFFIISKPNIYSGINLIRHIVLRFLSINRWRGLVASGIRRPDYFIGISSEGAVTFNAVRAALRRTRLVKGDNLIEIALNPGSAAEGEENSWPSRNRFMRFYYSDARRQERELLKSEDLKDLLARINFAE